MVTHHHATGYVMSIQNDRKAMCFIHLPLVGENAITVFVSCGLPLPATTRLAVYFLPEPLQFRFVFCGVLVLRPLYSCHKRAS